MSNFEIRSATADELPALNEQGHYAFANNDPGRHTEPSFLQPEWTLCAFDGDMLAATSGAFPFNLRINGNAVRADGVTMVTANPGYRRQGLVRQLITGLMHKARDNDVPVSILWASMGAIYQRFGYGLAASEVQYRLDAKRGAFQFGETARGRTRLVSSTDALPDLEDIYRNYARHRSGLVHRSKPMWNKVLHAVDSAPKYVAVHYDDSNKPTAFCIYKSQFHGSPGPSQQQVLSVVGFCWSDMNGYRGIWNYLIAHDLVDRIDFFRMPEDDPAPLCLLEPRALNRSVHDGIWLRVNDVSSALASRGYHQAGSVTLRISEDDLCPWNVGTYEVAADGKNEDAEVQRVADNAKPDIELSINALASLLTGQFSATELCRVGRAKLQTKPPQQPGKLLEIDALFSTLYRPHCPDSF